MSKLSWNEALTQLNIAPTSQQAAQLQAYLHLLQRWNKVYNLTAIRDPEAMLAVHLWDSLSIVPYIQAETCLDVGSGAGLPGIPLAIMQPKHRFTLLDSNGKKTRFMQQAVMELGLSNVQVVNTRAEQWLPEQPFAAIISRAFAALKDFVDTSATHLQASGRLYAMKGRFPRAELDSLPASWKVLAVHKLRVPALEAERHLLELGRIT
ncbi:MAG: 16S rRNA (guanine(527)-N(7))-methyltransferase RsmG [Proteobacteria bacterium]|nr:MAG: 16S rRNA (guanine(527)-N(7))-methyltransferase RsmG [Pseudomonadota bacterium]